MDRHAKAQQAKRKAAARQKKVAAAFGNAWATIVFVDGRGFAIRALYGTRDEAEEAARQETRKALDDAGYTRAPYSAVFAAPVERPNLAPKYERGTEYYAALRAAVGGQVHARAVFLFATEAEARMAAQITAGAGPQKLTVLGGPVSLARLA